MKKFTFVLTAAAVLVAAPLSAQWSTIGTLGDGGEFWDNPSQDGVGCNAGYILTGVAATSSCNNANQRPAGWLPYTGVKMTEYFSGGGGGAPTLTFLPGSFMFSLIGGTQGGDVAGQDRDWGYFGAVVPGDVNLNGAGALPTTETFSNPWGLWVSTTDNNIARSTTSGQFALFRGQDDGGLWHYIVGIEDINIRDASDRDYNDMFFAITPVDPDTPLEVVPEPATMTLLATGLAGMAAARRRRKNQS